MLFCVSLSPDVFAFVTHSGYQVDVVEAGRMGLDGGAMFGIVPKPLWSKRITPDEQNRIPLAMRCLLLRGHGRTILVDTGVGHKEGEKFRRIHAVDHDHSTLLGSLSDLDVQPEDVTDVILTHLHFDHAGGAVSRRDDGRLTPTFPEAAVHLQRTHWEWAQQSPREQASFLAENLEPLEASGQLVLADGPGVSPFPNIRFEVVDGHTRGQQLVVIEDGRRPALLYAADLLPTHAHVPLLWVMAYDVEPLVTLREKQDLLARAADERWIVVFEHDPGVVCARIERSARGFQTAQLSDSLSSFA